MFRWQPIVANRATGSRGLVAYDGRTSRVTYLETLRISGSRGRSRRIMRSGALAANGEEPRDTSHGVTSAPGYTSDSDSEGIDLIESDICDGAIAPTGGLVRTPTGKKLKLHLYHVDAAPETGGKRDLLVSLDALIMFIYTPSCFFRLKFLSNLLSFDLQP